MRRLVPIVTICVLVLAAACGGGDQEERSSGGSGDDGLDVCSLVSDRTVQKLQKTSIDRQGKPSEIPMRGAEMFVECRIISGVEVGYAVRVAPGGPALETLIEGAYDEPAEPLPGVGDEALIGINTYDGVRIVAHVGDQELIVDSHVADGDDEITRDVLIALAKEVAGNLGTEKVERVRLPKACPSTSDDTVTRTVGDPVTARGSATSAGVTCSYIGQERKVTLSAVDGDHGWNLMALADSPAENRIEIDGDPALYDDRDGVAVFSGDTCVLAASVEPVAHGMADTRPDDEQRDEEIALVKHVKESIGCP
jgi:hypothetical protein